MCRIPPKSLSTPGTPESGQYCTRRLRRIRRLSETARNKLLARLNGMDCPPGWQECKDIGDRTSSAVDDRRQIVGAHFQQENSLRRRTSGRLWHRDE